LPQIYFFYKSK